ncbi:MAG TPA: hypothetical protein VK849_10515 [Longimicrobiales bacterium]|nr:hypothetical protein [Longimicrobiales bacterium]
MATKKTPERRTGKKAASGTASGARKPGGGKGTAKTAKREAAGTSTGRKAGAKKAPAKKAPAKKAPAKKAPAKKAPAKKAAAGRASPGKAPAKKAAARKAPEKKAPSEAPATEASRGKAEPATAVAEEATKAAESATEPPRRKKKRSRPPGSREAAPARRPGSDKAYRPKATMGPDGTLVLVEDKVLLKAYYAGQQLPSPMGGFLMLLGIRPAPDGGAAALFECSASSLRYTLSIPKATRSERTAVRQVQDAGEDPDCPRHGPGQRLVRAGPHLICQLCGVSFAKV